MDSKAPYVSIEDVMGILNSLMIERDDVEGFTLTDQHNQTLRTVIKKVNGLSMVRDSPAVKDAGDLIISCWVTWPEVSSNSSLRVSTPVKYVPPPSLEKELDTLPDSFTLSRMRDGSRDYIANCWDFMDQTPAKNCRAYGKTAIEAVLKLKEALKPKVKVLLNKY